MLSGRRSTRLIFNSEFSTQIDRHAEFIVLEKLHTFNIKYIDHLRTQAKDYVIYNMI